MTAIDAIQTNPPQAARALSDCSAAINFMQRMKRPGEAALAHLLWGWAELIELAGLIELIEDVLNVAGTKGVHRRRRARAR